MFDIQQRDAPEQLVLTEQRHVQVPELSRWIGEAIGRLAQSAQRYGGVAAPIFVIYHGEVNQDSDGPVEVCVPVNPEQPVSADSAMRGTASSRSLRQGHKSAGRVPPDPVRV